MTHFSFDQQLDLLESQLQELGGSLIAGDSALLQAASTKLQQLAVDLIQMADAPGRTQLRRPDSARRIRALSAGVATVRENLLRQSAYVDHALALVVPATQQKSTYAGTRTYGGPIRQSGAFSVLSA
jgi:hypothetical protein